ncbi:Nuclease-related domain-containing protein [Collimonas sp. OK607]|uniref:nuclease-related domain-containing protein n=1 Tax=Collimonas sp. OK607 TaxID=1798194 RepID=UPI0008E3F4C5|nr:nuclease-related domain-containing protein [Collimonas sp. OK607]SFB38700.1 Nuclease-related domain-containing protein [Collimonas sp. OK607]
MHPDHITNENLVSTDFARTEKARFLQSITRSKRTKTVYLAPGIPAHSVWMTDVSAMDRRSVKAQLAGRGDYRVAWWELNCLIHRLLKPRASLEHVMYAFHTRHHVITPSRSPDWNWPMISGARSEPLDKMAPSLACVALSVRYNNQRETIMSHKKNNNDDFLTAVGGTILAWGLLAMMWATTTIMLAIFFLLKRPISRALHLEWCSTSWSSTKLLYGPIKCLAGILFLFMLVGASRKLSVTHAHADQIMAGVLKLCAGLSGGLLFNILHWMEQYSKDPAIQKKMAGIAAERYVQKLIEDCRTKDLPVSRSLHGKLFVFNEHTPNEFSVEVDHMLITERNVFVIETKCKSGTLSTGADFPTWKVSSPYGDSQMRNALKQVKNAARVLQRQTALPCELIPLVAIKGNDVKIVDGPTNVLVAAEIGNVLRAFEHGKPHPILDPASVIAMLLPHVNDDPAAMKRHVERANAARVRAEMTEIVNAASIR